MFGFLFFFSAILTSPRNNTQFTVIVLVASAPTPSPTAYARESPHLKVRKRQLLHLKRKREGGIERISAVEGDRSAT